MKNKMKKFKKANIFLCLAFLFSYINISCSDSVIQKGDFDIPAVKKKSSKIPKHKKSQAELLLSQEGITNFSDCIVYDKESANILNTPMINSNYNPDGQTVSFTHKKIQSSSELNDLLKAGAKLSTSSNLKPKFKAGLGVIDEKKSSDNYRYYFYSIEVENPVVTLKNIKLSDEAKKLYLIKGLNAFYKRCGKEVTIGYKTGGFLYHIIKISKKSNDNLSSLDSLIASSGFGFGLSGRINSSEKIYTDDLHFEVYSNWKGGKGQFAFTNIKDLSLMSEKWPDTVANNAVVLENITMTYEDLLSAVEDPHYQIIAKESQAFLDELTRLNNIKYELLNIVAKKSSNSSNQKSEIFSQKQIKKLEKLIMLVSSQIKKCENATDIENCQNLQLLIRSKQYRFSVTKEHHTCSVKSYYKEYKRHKSCGIEKYKQQSKKVVNYHCPVLSYKKGIIFSKIIMLTEHENTTKLAKYYPEYCHKINVDIGYTIKSKDVKKRIPYCHAKSDNCLFMAEKININYISYEIYCKARDKKFGVEKYSECDKKYQVPIYKNCLVQTSKPKSYNRCLLTM